ncbi:hypothetical protein [Nocardioides sp. SYSU DS0651]|uniref:hypothetical protein n=1 Tax=Nocardioides sp. SYSU DS0651 TaxID=3415955 RepID=UPI003F4C25AB
MSQTAAPQAAASPSSAPPPAVATGRPPAPQQQPAFVDTPALLNRWQLIGMTVAIGFGLLSALVQLLGWQADGRAAADTEQLVRVQEVKTSLLRADALATNAFLVGGLEDTGQRAEYDAAVDEALRKIAEAADAQPADQEALAVLNRQVSDYATAIAQARTNNRQGFPVGAAYQSLASDQLRDEAIPVLDELVEANTERAESAMGGQHPWWLLLLGVLAVAALWSLNRRLARAFHRHVNKGVALAAGIVALATLAAVTWAWLQAGANDDLRDGSFAEALSSANARTAANDAKANESLRLIKRGSGADNEERWAEAAEVVADNAPAAALPSWREYAARHADIVAADDGNGWDAAVRIATRSDDRGSTAPHDRFDAIVKESVDTASASTIDDLRSGRWLGLVLSILTALLGVVAAVAVARGIGERRREFS